MLEIVTIVGGVSAAFIAIVSSVFMNIRHSRCTHIDCCGIQCKRSVMTLDEIERDNKQYNHNQISNITV